MLNIKSILLIITTAVLCCLNTASANLKSSAVRSSVVKIYATMQKENYAMPWQGGRTGGGTGTGFIIKGKRILSNAHVVSDARFIQVQKDGDPKRYNASVVFPGHDCDLAVLEVDDHSFFDNTKPLKFADEMPTLNDEVFVLGFPMGGARLSITKGIVSRIDYSVYTHSGVDLHLVMQVDAAINPGNSGGPIVFDNKVVGVAFQGLMWGDNIGYGIPLPVIEHFLDDIKDGTYHGYPELGVHPFNARNPAIRKHLQMPKAMTGSIVSYVDPLHSAYGHLKARDVLTSIDGYEIANDGSVRLNGEDTDYSELIERKQFGDKAQFKVWRDGAEIEVTVPLKVSDDPFIYRNLYDTPARYFIKGGLVFSPLSSELLRAAKATQDSGNSHYLLYAAEFAKIDGFYKERNEFVVLLNVLKHESNTYSDSFRQGIVDTVNGVTISELKDMKDAFTKQENGFHVITFLGIDNKLVIDSEAAEQADVTIISQYGISEPSRLESK
ncbi:hypothetical protein BVX97_05170 [bacterium E08(2017)]|nr:hypothetical protein BVX97_05170 [bacterium E08(2017)]